MKVAIIICSSRLEDLSATLEQLSSAAIGGETDIEVIVVANNVSQESFAALQHRVRCLMQIRFEYSQAGSKAASLNHALASTESDVAVFIDDDVSVGRAWLSNILHPIMHQGFDVVFGGISLPPEVLEQIDDELIKSWLGDNLRLNNERAEVVAFPGGANWAVRREWILKIGGFDERFGPGRGCLGNCEDTLAFLRLEAAGARICRAPDARVVHRVQLSKLSVIALRQAALSRGRSHAYMDLVLENCSLRVSIYLSLIIWRIRSALESVVVRASGSKLDQRLARLLFADFRVAYCRGLIAAVDAAKLRSLMQC